MRILLLCEGDAETRDSWSGISKSVVETLRSGGHQVIAGDVDLYGRDRLTAAVRTFSPERARWGARYHFSRVPYEMRSRRAARLIASHRERVDVILQFGATFEPRGRGEIPYFLYCDSNIALADRHRASGFGAAVQLRAGELEEIDQREAGIYRDAAGIFTISDYLARSFVTDYDIPADRVTTIHAGPNFDPDAINARPARPSGRPPTILFVGRQFERKGGPQLLAAFERVRDRVPDAQLWIIGPSTLADLPPGVRSLGFVNKDHPGGWDRLAAAYASADIFCLPTRFEPFGIVFVEAMHFGLPCIGPEAWAVPEIIADEVSGFTIPPGDIERLSERLVRLLGDPALATQMGQAGHEIARKEFTWPAVVNRMLNAIQVATSPC